MKQALYKTYGERQPCGATYITNCFGLLVYEPTEEDRTEADYITAWSAAGYENRGFHRSKVYYTNAGRAYLRKGSLKFYLDEITKI